MVHVKCRIAIEPLFGSCGLGGSSRHACDGQTQLRVAILSPPSLLIHQPEIEETEPRFKMEFPPKGRRRQPGKPDTQTDGNTGRKRLAGSASPSRPLSVAEEAKRKFGATLQRLRQQSGLSQEQLAHDSGVPATEMNEIEE